MAIETLFTYLPGWQGVVFIELLIVFLVVGGFISFRMLRSRFWPYTYIVFEKRPPYGYIPVFKGRCRLMKVGDTGEELYYLKDLKVWKIAYGKRIGTNQICWTIREEDGLWYDTVFGDFDQKLHELGIMPVHRDMRYAYASSRKLVDKEYLNKTWMEKYLVPITLGMLFLCMVAMFATVWYSYKSAGELAASNAQTVEKTVQILDKADKILGKANAAESPSGFISSTVLPGGT